MKKIFGFIMGLLFGVLLANGCAIGQYNSNFDDRTSVYVENNFNQNVHVWIYSPDGQPLHRIGRIHMSVTRCLMIPYGLNKQIVLVIHTSVGSVFTPTFNPADSAGWRWIVSPQGSQSLYIADACRP